MKHSLFTALQNLKGNPRGCVYTEPLWGIPFNLYAPYVSVYMLALGVSKEQIGLIASIAAVFQVVLALLSGVITDKFGRRLTTLVFDILSWSVPALISAIAQNVWYFLIAALVNSVWRITHNSWTCLLVEDAEQDQLVDIFTWIYVANLLVGFIAPLAGLLVAQFSMVPTVRALYLFAAVMFTVKAVATYLMTEETAQGKIRMHETSQQSVATVLAGYWPVLRDLLRTPQTLYTAGIMLVLSISTLITGNFWAIIVTQKLQFPDQALSIFPFVRSAVMILFFFVIIPRISRLHFKVPLVVGFLGIIVGQLILITAPAQSYVLLLVSVFVDACSFAVVQPLIDRMTVLTIDPKERARIQSIIYVAIILFTSPFGWVAGWLSELSNDLPFILHIVLLALGALLAYLAGQAAQKQLADETVTVEAAA